MSGDAEAHGHLAVVLDVDDGLGESLHGVNVIRLKILVGDASYKYSEANSRKCGGEDFVIVAALAL